jgi:hypothetical protein
MHSAVSLAVVHLLPQNSRATPLRINRTVAMEHINSNNKHQSANKMS